jgi:opacity protein-like surface antigen
VIRDRKGDWLQVTFEDARLGARTGWLESRFVRIRQAGAGLPPPAPPGTTPPATGARSAQPPPATPPSRSAPPRPGIGIRGFGTFAIDWMTARDTFEAVTGSATVLGYGGGVQVTNLWRGLFVEASAERSAADGERVFVHQDEVFPLGIPLEVTMTPLDVVVGWRSPQGRVTPFFGGGATFMRYEETSDFADAGDDIDERKTGFIVLAGAEASLARWIHLRGDVRYRQVSGVLGEGGASAAFDEDRLGGFGVAVKLMIGR